jgi:hypothetical protein
MKAFVLDRFGGLEVIHIPDAPDPANATADHARLKRWCAFGKTLPIL